MKNHFRILFIFLIIGVIFPKINGQNKIKDMLKYTLNEKMYMKLGKSDQQNDVNSIDLRDFGGDLLVADNAEGAESEMYAAINPFDTMNMVVASIHFAYNTAFNSPLSISIYYTKDFGNTWQKSNFDGVDHLSGVVVGGGDPVLSYDSKGNLHLTYIILEITNLFDFKAKEKIIHAVSKDGGENWNYENYYESAEFDVFTFEGLNNFLDKQWMVSDLSSSQFMGNTYMVFVNFDFEDLNSEKLNIAVDVLEDGDSIFAFDPITITSDSFYFVQFSSIDVDNDGNVFIGFVGSYDSLNYFIFNSVSVDGGKSFSEPRKVSPLIYPGYSYDTDYADIKGISTERFYPCPYLAIDKSDKSTSGRIYFSWTSPGIVEIEETGYDIYLSYSDDKGNTWKSPKIVNNDKLSDGDQFYSTINISPEGIPILCFYDKRNDNQNKLKTDYFVAYSKDNENPEFDVQYNINSKYSDFGKIGKKNEDFGIGEYNKTVCTSNFTFAFWADGRKNDGDINIYMAKVPLDRKIYNAANEISVINNDFKILSLSPNPAISTVSIEFESIVHTQIQYSVFDLNGKLIKNDFLGNLPSGKGSTNIDISDMESGIYFIRFQNQDNTYITRKLIVEK